MQVKVASPEESGRIVARENVSFSMEITTKGAQSLRIMKTRDAELYLRYSYLRLSPAWREIVQTSVKVGKTRLLPLVRQLRAQEQAFN